MRVFGKVKSFDRAAGVGCAVTDGGAQAAFTAAVLVPFGLSAIDEGVALTFELTLDGGRLRVAKIYDIAGRVPGDSRPDAAKGFGFKVSKDLDGDVLLHKSVIDAFGAGPVLEGAPVDSDVVQIIKSLQAAPPVTRVTGRVSSYNREKGFGFVVTKDIDGDVLLHRSVLEAFGIDALLAGAQVDFDAMRKVKGYHAVRLHAVLPPEKPIEPAPFVAPSESNGGCIVIDDAVFARRGFPAPIVVGGGAWRRHPKGFGFVMPSDDPLEQAVCKWFSRPKGYGFVRLEDSDEGIFVHMDTLRRCGMRMLMPGQRVRVRVARADKGLVVTAIEPDDADDDV